MVQDLNQDAAVRLRTFSQMTLDEVAIVAAKEPVCLAAALVWWI